MIPSEKDLKADAVWLGFNEYNVKRLLAHARRARSAPYARDGFKTTHGASGTRTSGLADPVGEMATEDDGPTPEIIQQQEILFDMLHQAVLSKKAVQNTMDRIEGIQTCESKTEKRGSVCCTEGCDGTAEVRGRCALCAEWQEANPYPDGTYREVPSEVIAERTRRRAKAS